MGEGESGVRAVGSATSVPVQWKDTTKDTTREAISEEMGADEPVSHRRAEWPVLKPISQMVRMHGLLAAME